MSFHILYLLVVCLSQLNYVFLLYFAMRNITKLDKYFNLPLIANLRVTHAGKSSRSVFASQFLAGAKIPRRETHRAEETGATSKTRRPATSEHAGSKVKTIAYNWHMKFKGGVIRRTGGKAGGSLNTPAVFEPLFFSRPSASLEIYISSLLLELSVYPAFF